MEKKIIGIDINEVLRAYLYAIEEHYKKEFGDEAVVTKPINTTDLLNHYEFKEKTRKVSYIMDDEDGWISSDVKFEEVTETITKELALKYFLYEDYTFEIFASTGKMYSNVFTDLNTLYRDYRDDYEFIILAKENNITIKHTLFFLSKNGIQLQNYKFVSSIDEVWDYCDIYITTNPQILNQKPFGKISIKVRLPYNTDTNSDYNIFRLDELKDGEILNKLKSKSIFDRILQFLK
jgi:hypothetical protein